MKSWYIYMKKNDTIHISSLKLTSMHRRLSTICFYSKVIYNQLCKIIQIVARNIITAEYNAIHIFFCTIYMHIWRIALYSLFHGKLQFSKDDTHSITRFQSGDDIRFLLQLQAVWKMFVNLLHVNISLIMYDVSTDF